MTNRRLKKQSIVLLVDKQSRNDIHLKQWLAENNLIAREASDVFEAIEEISDFTVSQRPDVLLLEADASTHTFVKEMLRTSFGSRDFQVIAFSKTIFEKTKAKSQAANMLS